MGMPLWQLLDDTAASLREQESGWVANFESRTCSAWLLLRAAAAGLQFQQDLAQLLYQVASLVTVAQVFMH